MKMIQKQNTLFYNIALIALLAVFPYSAGAETNVIQNPSLEVVNPSNPSLPNLWQKGFFGTNTTSFNYPVAGYDGARAASITMTAYSSGDAKWIFNDVPAAPGEKYKFTGYYTATAPTTIMLRFKKTTGGFIYQQLKTLPPAGTWTAYEGIFTAPAGVTSMTVLHLLKSVGTVTIDNQSIVSLDSVAPTATIISPSNSQTISNTITIGVAASDNTVVADVHILVDNISVAIDSSSPYEALVDTTTLSNGSHTITAYAEDSAGNIGNAAPVSITVSNQTLVNNLINNPSVEIANASNPNLPNYWKTGKWGTNTALFSYPVAGVDGAKAVRLEMGSYSSGDAKWFFSDIPVTEGKSYTYSERYRSSVPTKVIARFTLANGSFQYRDIFSLPSTSDWKEGSTTITIPAGVISFTSFHLLNAVGFLETDNYSFALPPETPPAPSTFSQGMVSLTFDDGWMSHYDTVLPILNTAHLKGSFYIITDEMNGALPDNRISNGDFESVDLNGDPTGWHKGSWGNNDAVFTYPVPGVSGSSAAKIQITNYTDGDAKWFFDDATVLNGQEYTYSEYYQSDILTSLLARFTYKDNTVEYRWIGDAGPADTWTQFTKTILMPQNLASITIFHFIVGVGSLSIDNADLERVPVYMTPTQVKSLSDTGNEIGSHTLTHPYLTTLLSADAKHEIEKSKADLISLGIPVTTFVYPYGDFNASVIQLVKNAGYIGARSTTPGFNNPTSEKYALMMQQIDRTTTLSQFQTWVDTARQNKQWLILMFHQVNDDATESLGVSPALFQQMVDFLVAEQVTVVPMNYGITQMH